MSCPEYPNQFTVSITSRQIERLIQKGLLPKNFSVDWEQNPEKIASSLWWGLQKTGKGRKFWDNLLSQTKEPLKDPQAFLRHLSIYASYLPERDDKVSSGQKVVLGALTSAVVGGAAASLWLRAKGSHLTEEGPKTKTPTVLKVPTTLEAAPVLITNVEEASELLQGFLGISYKPWGYKDDQGNWCSFRGGNNLKIDNQPGFNCAGFVLEATRSLYGPIKLSEVVVQRRDGKQIPRGDSWLGYGYDFIMNLAEKIGGQPFLVKGLDWKEDSGFALADWDKVLKQMKEGSFYLASINKEEKNVGRIHSHVIIILPTKEGTLIYECVSSSGGVHLANLGELKERYSKSENYPDCRMFVVEANLPGVIKVPEDKNSLSQLQPEKKELSTSPSVTVKPTSPPESTFNSNSNKVYFVKPGDTLGEIAKRFGVSPEVLARANKIYNPNLIRVGQKLIIDVEGKNLSSLPPRLAKYSEKSFEWEKIPADLKEWLIFELWSKADKYKIPPPLLLAIMAAEQNNSNIVHIEETPSIYGATGIFQMMEGWVKLYGQPGEDPFKVSQAIEMMSRRLSQLGLTAERFQKLTDEEKYKLIGNYLCKHLNGEGVSCTSFSGITGKYVQYGIEAIKKLQKSGTLEKFAQLAVEEQFRKDFDARFGHLPTDSEVQERLKEAGNQIWIKIAWGEISVKKIASEMLEKSIEQRRAWKNPNAIKKVAVSVSSSEPKEKKTSVPASGFSKANIDGDSKKSIGNNHQLSQQSDTLANKQNPLPSQEKPQKTVIVSQIPEDVCLNEQEEKVQEAAVKYLGHRLPRKELQQVLKQYGNDSAKIIEEYIGQSKEKEIFLYAQELWRKKTEEEPLNGQIRPAILEALKVWKGKDPRLVTDAEVEEAKRKLEQILEISPTDNQTSVCLSPNFQSISGSEEKQAWAEKVKNLGADSKVVQAIEFAVEQLGEVYQLGQEGPNKWDCARLVYTAYLKAGIKFDGLYGGKVVVDQWNMKLGRILKENEALKPGDLVFFVEKKSGRFAHVGMIIDPSTKEFIEASYSAGGVVISSLDPEKPNYARYLKEGKYSILGFKRIVE